MIGTASGVSCSEALKAATKEEHAQTEKGLIPRLKGARTSEDYRHILGLFYGYYAPMEALLEPYLTADILPDLPQRRKSSRILSDLKTLGAQTGALPLCRALPSVRNSVQALGALYVLEGATLGGVIIARMLQKGTGLEDASFSFFRGYGEANETLWQEFRERLNAHVTGAEEREEVIAAAKETFRTFKNWIITY